MAATHLCPRCPKCTWDVPGNGWFHTLVLCPMCTRDYLGHPGISQLRAIYTALSYVQDVPCLTGITCDILGCPSSEPATQTCPMSPMSHVSLGLLRTSWDVPAKSWLHRPVPCPRYPMSSWDYLGDPGMSQLRANYTALSHVSNVPCTHGIT